MAKKIIKKEGNIFFIPLFLPLDIKDNNKSYSKFKFSPEETYAFDRLIEIDLSGGDLVEIFKYIGKIPSTDSIIINSGILFSPIHISLGFVKKRWQFIFEGNNYDKNIDSNYGNLTFLLGTPENPKLWVGGIVSETKEYDENKYNKWIVYPSTKVEKIIKEKM